MEHLLTWRRLWKRMTRKTWKWTTPTKNMTQKKVMTTIRQMPWTLYRQAMSIFMMTMILTQKMTKKCWPAVKMNMTMTMKALEMKTRTAFQTIKMLYKGIWEMTCGRCVGVLSFIADIDAQQELDLPRDESGMLLGQDEDDDEDE